MGQPTPENPKSLQPGRLWSLSDMINGSVSQLCALSGQLMLMELLLDPPNYQKPKLDSPISKSDKETAEGWLKIAASVADDFEIQALRDRINVITKRLGFDLTHRQLADEWRVLRETLDFGLKGHLIYRYPTEKGDVLRRWKVDWEAARQSFPSAEDDIRASVDLWAMYHSTAAVFHLMRVLEHGLRALAADLGKTFDIQNWQNILDEIEAEIRAQGKSLPRGMPKTERLRFLSEAAKEFSFFKDGWRNYVSHSRANYDEHQARSVMDHVRTFMNGLAAQLSEQQP
jgi:hypothetical protein